MKGHFHIDSFPSPTEKYTDGVLIDVLNAYVQMPRTKVAIPENSGSKIKTVIPFPISDLLSIADPIPPSKAYQI